MGHELMRAVTFVTIGCKLNRFESEQMRELAECGGFVCPQKNGKADIYVVNTCTVTSKSDYRSRQAVRRAIRANPRALIVVTGCYAQRSPEDLASIEGVDVVIGNKQKQKITDYLGMDKPERPLIETTEPHRITSLPSHARLHRFGGYTRAFVKIQDGCDNRCSYCAVPLARGGSRSKRPEDVIEEIEILAGEGFREIVLTGVHLGSYGQDLAPPASLPELLQSMAGVPRLKRVRLSSIEPTDFSDGLIDAMADMGERICPHVHVPLQSGDDRILRAMGRRYTAEQYGSVIRKITGAVPCCGVGADVMVGFPGEDDAAFQNTQRLIEDLPITYLHVFSFSMRWGTPAASFEGQVDPLAKKRRSRTLRELGRVKSRAFRESLIDKRLDVIILGPKAGNLSTGLSGNYVKTYLREEIPVGHLVQACVIGVERDGVFAATERTAARP